MHCLCGRRRDIPRNQLRDCHCLQIPGRQLGRSRSFCRPCEGPRGSIRAGALSFGCCVMLRGRRSCSQQRGRRENGTASWMSQCACAVCCSRCWSFEELDAEMARLPATSQGFATSPCAARPPSHVASDCLVHHHIFADSKAAASTVRSYKGRAPANMCSKVDEHSICYAHRLPPLPTPPVICLFIECSLFSHPILHYQTTAITIL
jgi:hypothetical protein